MADKKGVEVVSYAFGIMSIVFAFFLPSAGLVLGIIGFVQSRKQKDDLSKRAKKFSIIGMVLSAIFFAGSMALALGLGSNLIPQF